MSYATQQNLIDRCSEKELQQLTDRAIPPAGTIDDAIVAEALADADAEINAYIAVRVTTPVSPVPRILVTHAVSIARYRLWKDRASAKVTSDYQDAIAWAQAVAAGKAALGDTTTPTAPPSVGAPRVSAPDRTFTGDKLRGY